MEDILAYFGYSLKIEKCDLKGAGIDPEQFSGLRARLDKVLLCIRLTSENARREFLIAPVFQTRWSSMGVNVYMARFRQAMSGVSACWIGPRNRLHRTCISIALWKI